jgi:signal transduction histidine kinase
MESNGPFESDQSPQLGALMMVVHLASDLRVLLAAMLNCIDSIRAKVPQSPEADEAFAAFDSAIDNAFYISRELIAMSAPKAPDSGVIDLNELITQVRGILERVLGPRIRLSFNLQATAPIVQAGAAQLEWVLLNLAANGRDAMPDGGTLMVETTSVDAPSRDLRAASRHHRYVRMTVRDTGGGTISTAPSSTFEPDFTRKGGRNLGLTGVAITSRLLNGSLHVQSNQPYGTEVHIYLPVVSTADENPARRPG